MNDTAISIIREEILDPCKDELGPVEVLTGNEVLLLLTDDSFIKEWDNLYHVCPWSTVFQSSVFVCSWYQHYGDQHSPILALSRYKGKLTGLLPLAAGISGLGIAGAGGYDAYYHTWLTHAHHGESFITTALHAIRKLFAGRDIFLKYIPPKTPMAWLGQDPVWAARCVTRTFSRPLLDLSDPDTDKLVRKRNFREKYNRLKRIGDICLEPVQDIDRFSEIIDHLANQYDFRKAATHNIRPFRENPAKKRFMVDLFRKGILITSVLKVNDEIIAALVATTGKDGWVHGAGINTHAPAYSKYSPGYIIMQMFGLQLKQDRYAVLDITPGGHAYKERHANVHDQVIELRVTNSIKAQYLRHLFTGKELLKAKLQAHGLNPQQLNQSLATWVSITKDKYSVSRRLLWLPLLEGNMKPQATLKVFDLTLPESTRANTLTISKDSLHDLLNYSSQATSMARMKFMNRAMELFQKGYRPYTYCENDVLQCLVWQVPQDSKSLEKSLTSLPSDAVLLKELYCHPKAADKLKAFLTEVATKLGASTAGNPVYLIGPSVPPALYKNTKFFTIIK